MIHLIGLVSNLPPEENSKDSIEKCNKTEMMNVNLEIAIALPLKHHVQ